MGSNINILYHSYQEWLKYQTFTAFQVKFHVFGSIINFPLTGNDLCYSQPKWRILSLFLMPVVQCIVAQWRLAPLKVLFQYLLVTTVICDAQPNCMGYFTCDNICGRKSVQ